MNIALKYKYEKKNKKIKPPKPPFAIYGEIV